MYFTTHLHPRRYTSSEPAVGARQGISVGRVFKALIFWGFRTVSRSAEGCCGGILEALFEVTDSLLDARDTLS